MIDHIKNGLDSLKIRKVLLLILLLSFCVPNLSPMLIAPAGIKLFRVVVAMIIFLCLIIFGKIKIPSWKVVLVFLGIAIISVLNYSKLGFERLFFEYIFAFAVLITAYSLGYGLDFGVYNNIAKKASLLTVAVVILNILIQHEAIVEFIVDPISNHPRYDSVFPGGCNLDATWVALFGLFYWDKPKSGYIYIVFSFLISALLSSRAGILLSFACLLYLVICHINRSKKRISGSAIIIGVLVFSAALLFSGAGGAVMNRLKDVGHDDASLSRMSLWTNGIETVAKNPYGYGAGNAVRAIEDNTGLEFEEDNVHNLLLQKTLDFGVAGLVIFVLLIAFFVKNTYKDIFKNPFYAYIYLYLVIGLIQFKGADSIVFYILGLCLVMLKLKRDGDKNEKRIS